MGNLPVVDINVPLFNLQVVENYLEPADRMIKVFVVEENQIVLNVKEEVFRRNQNNVFLEDEIQKEVKEGIYYLLLQVVQVLHQGNEKQKENLKDQKVPVSLSLYEVEKVD